MKRLRLLLRDADARREQGLVVLEGARLLHGARDRHATITALYGDGDGATPLAPGVIDRISEVRSPQPVIAVAVDPVRSELGPLLPGALLIGVDINDPGNAGTMIRSAEAAGCAAVVFAGSSVDPRNPKCIRSSAGAIFGIDVVEARDPVECIDALGHLGYRTFAAVARAGAAPEAVDCAGNVAFVVGSEAHGLAQSVIDVSDGAVTIPMHGPAESLNVAQAATILCFEAARQRRSA
ncbi:MAG: TrmH family RNA methyltransferase [Acidimicrobiia bacterium]